MSISYHNIEALILTFDILHYYRLKWIVAMTIVECRAFVKVKFFAVKISLQRCAGSFQIVFLEIWFQPTIRVLNVESAIQHSVHHIDSQATFNWRASSYPDFIQNEFLWKRMFDFFDNHDRSRKPGFLRGKIYTSCISMVLLDHFANKSNTFQNSLSSSLALPFPPWVSTSSDPRSQDCAINGTLPVQLVFLVSFY